MAWRFPVSYIFYVFLSKSMCISTFGPSSSPSNSLVILFIHSTFSICFFGCNILVQNHSVSFASGCWYVVVSFPPSCWWNFFRYFGMFCFVCIVLPLVDITLIFLLSQVFFGLFPQVVFFFSCVAFFFLFLQISVSLLCFIILANFRRFFFICVYYYHHYHCYFESFSHQH